MTRKHDKPGTRPAPRWRLVADYRKAVSGASLASHVSAELLATETINGLSDEELAKRTAEFKSISKSTKELAAKKEETVRQYVAGKPVSQSFYLRPWMRYTVGAIPPLGTLAFIFMATWWGMSYPYTVKVDSFKGLLRDTPDVLLTNAGRVAWGGTNGLFYAACAATIFFCLSYILPKAFAGRRRLLPYAFLIAIGPALWVGINHHSFQNYSALPLVLLNATVVTEKGDNPDAHPWQGIARSIEVFEGMVLAMHTFLTAICLILIWAVSKDVAGRELHIALCR
ncbi:MAG: hypothetical protein QOE46_388 [Acidobacteriota bacterium]|nr:hypothetical protein [Acidobacteriota bacterium]